MLAPGTGKTKTGRLWTYVRDERPLMRPPLRDRKFADSSLEGNGFELPVPRAIRLRFRDFALAGFADVHLRQLQIIERRRHAAEAGDYRRRPILHGTRNRKFDSISLQRRVCKLSVPERRRP